MFGSVLIWGRGLIQWPRPPVYVSGTVLSGDEAKALIESSWDEPRFIRKKDDNIGFADFADNLAFRTYRDALVDVDSMVLPTRICEIQPLLSGSEVRIWNCGDDGILGGRDIEIRSDNVNVCVIEWDVASIGDAK